MDYDESQGTFGNFLKHRLNYYFWDKAKIKSPISLDYETKDGANLLDTLVSDDDLEGEFFDKEEYKDLYDKIKSLEEKDVLLIRLKYWEGLSDKKIGEIMDLAPKTIRNRHSMSLKKLRKMYGF